MLPTSKVARVKAELTRWGGELAVFLSPAVNEAPHHPKNSTAPGLRAAQPGFASPTLTLLHVRAAEIQNVEFGQGFAGLSCERPWRDASLGAEAQLGVGEIEPLQRGEADEGQGWQRPQRVPSKIQHTQAEQ